MNVVNPYLKTAVAVISTVLTGLSAYYGHTVWYPIVTSAMGVLLVFLVPNIPNTPPTPTTPAVKSGLPFTGDPNS